MNIVSTANRPLVRNISSNGEQQEDCRKTRITSVLTTCRSVLDFFSAQDVLTDDAKHHIDWARKTLVIIEEYTLLFEEQSQPRFAEGEQIVKYLDVLATSWEQTLQRQEQGRRHENITEWMQSFEVKMLGLPPELRRIIRKGITTRPPSIVESNDDLQQLLALPSSDKLKRAQVLLPPNPAEFASLFTKRGDVTFLPLKYHDESLILASYRIPSDIVYGTPRFQQLISSLSHSATGFNCMSSVKGIRLLKVRYFLYNEKCHQLLFAQTSPYPILSMRPLTDLIEEDPFPRITTSLTARVKLAHKLAEAVFFCHAAGLLHKNITSSSIVALRRSGTTTGNVIPDIDEAYLMVSDLISDTPAGTFNRHTSPKWDSEIFRHPDLLGGQKAITYIRAYDVYSLGVVLLEVGLWQRIGQAVIKDLTSSDILDHVTELPKLLPKVGSRLGQRYQSLVKWCLGLKGDHIVGNDEFVREILIPLGDMAISI